MSTRPSPFLGAINPRRAFAQTAPKEVPSTRPDLKLVQGGPAIRLSAHTQRRRLVAYVSLAGVLLFAVVSFHVLLSQGQFGLRDMESRTAEEQANYERLRLQVAQLESPERITQEAVERLGMVPAEQVKAVTPRAEDVAVGTGAGAVQTATGDDGTSDPANAHTWAELKPHLSAKSQ